MSKSETPQGPMKSAYTLGTIQVLKDAEHIRRRPGMYIGDTGQNGLHHLVGELLDNSVNEVLAGFCKNIRVQLGDDGCCAVRDDGRGIPVDVNHELGISTLEAMATLVFATGKFDHGAYKVSAGLHGVGLKAVTALSEWMRIQVWGGGRLHRQEYVRGQATGPVEDLGPSDRTGTEVTFRPDPQIFGETTFDYAILAIRLRELAFLNKGLVLCLTDDRSGQVQKFEYAGGLVDFVAEETADEEKFHSQLLFVERTVPLSTECEGEMRVEVAMQFTNAEIERSFGYVNNLHTPMGGTHLTGVRIALATTLGDYGKKHKSFGRRKPSGEDFRRGLTYIVSIQHPRPMYSGATKDRLGDPEVEGIVAQVVSEELARFLDDNPDVAQRIIRKVAFEASTRVMASHIPTALRRANETKGHR